MPHILAQTQVLSPQQPKKEQLRWIGRRAHILRIMLYTRHTCSKCRSSVEVYTFRSYQCTQQYSRSRTHMYHIIMHTYYCIIIMLCYEFLSDKCLLLVIWEIWFFTDHHISIKSDLHECVERWNGSDHIGKCTSVIQVLETSLYRSVSMECGWGGRTSCANGRWSNPQVTVTSSSWQKVNRLPDAS